MKPANILLAFLVVSTILSSCSTSVMNRNEAERSLKVLNSDLINFLEKSSGTPEYKTLNFLLSATESPLPFKKSDDNKIILTDFNFGKNCGEYRWDTDIKSFYKTDENEHIIIHLDNVIENGIKFILYNYTDTTIAVRQKFSLAASAKIFLNKKEIWNIEYSSNLVDGMPENIHIKSCGSGYCMEGEFKRTKDGDNGTINGSFNFHYNGIKLIESEFQSTVGYSYQGFYFKQVDFSQKFSGHYLKGNFNYGKINPTSDNYVSSFNRNSDFKLFEKNIINGKYIKVGDLLLAETENRELLDYYIKFSDGNKVLIGNYLTLFEEMKNYKF